MDGPDHTYQRGLLRTMANPSIPNGKHNRVLDIIGAERHHWYRNYFTRFHPPRLLSLVGSQRQADHVAHVLAVLVYHSIHSAQSVISILHYQAFIR